jgi:hypothetical protein
VKIDKIVPDFVPLNGAPLAGYRDMALRTNRLFLYYIVPRTPTMAFDFYDEYKDYPNLELLKIIRNPNDYQPLTVAAASQILDERQVPGEEIGSLDQSLHALAEAERYKREKFARMTAKTADLFPPIAQPHKEVEPSKWVNLFLLVIAARYAWMLFGMTKRLIRLLSRQSFDWFDYINFVPVLYVPFIFFLIFKRRRWGWILLFADNLAALIMMLSESYIFFKYQHLYHSSIVSFITPIMIRSAFTFFLWRNAITEYFGVSSTIKKRTALVVAGVTLLFVVAIPLLES